MANKPLMLCTQKFHQSMKRTLYSKTILSTMAHLSGKAQFSKKIKYPPQILINA